MDDGSVVVEVCENGAVDDGVKLLTASNDEHGGVVVEMKEPIDPDSFGAMLKASLMEWKRQGKRGVWIKLPIALADLIGAAVKQGFTYHHAEPSYLMLVHWIPVTASTIPANASHRVGIGAIVLTEKRELAPILGPCLNPRGYAPFWGIRIDNLTKEILVVQEKCGNFRGTGVWKIPTGVVDEGEDIFMAATREVKEETGIDAEFLEILAFRQTHKTFYEKSDLFFLCMMRPVTFDVQKQELEIEAAQWMPFEEYAAQPIAQQNELFKSITELFLAKVDREYTGFSPLPPMPTSNGLLYANVRDLKQSQSESGDQSTSK